MTTGEVISEKRKELGWTQEKLAEMMNASRPTISYWESGKCMPDTTKIIAMSKIFRCSTDDLLNPMPNPVRRERAKGTEAA